MKIVVLTTASVNACRWWRIDRPLAMIKRVLGSAFEYEIVNLDNMGEFETNIRNAIVILHRLNFKDPYTYIQKLRLMGPKALVYELDDDIVSEAYINYLQDNKVPSFKLKLVEKSQENTKQLLRMVDAVTCTNYYLYDVVREYTQAPIYVLPNYIDFDDFTSKIKKGRLTNDVVIGWGGGKRPDSDFSDMAEAWRLIAEDYPNIKFAIAGYQPDILYDKLENFMDRIVRIPWVSVDEWPNSMKFDIGCIGMANTPFNKCKSVIKYFEYSLAGTPTIVDNKKFENIITNYMSGIVLKEASVTDWVNAIEYMLENEARRVQIAKTAFYEVSNYYSLHKRDNIGEWIAAYEMISNEDTGFSKQE